MYKQYDPEVLKSIQSMQLEILKEVKRICDEHKIDYFIIYGTLLGAVRHKGTIPWDDDIDICMLRKDYERFLKLCPTELDPQYEIATLDRDLSYPIPIVKVQKKGTRFADKSYRFVKHPLGVFIDIFILDNLSDSEIEANKQFQQASFWNKLLVIQALPFPVLNASGLKGKAIHVATAVAHIFLKLVSRNFLNQKYLSVCKRYNQQKTSRVITFAELTANMKPMEFNKLYPLSDLIYEDTVVKAPNLYKDILIDLYGDYMQLPPDDQRRNHCPYFLDLGSGQVKI